MVYICTEFGEIILNGLCVMERTRFLTDRQTDGQTYIYGKNNMSSNERRGDIIITKGHNSVSIAE